MPRAPVAFKQIDVVRAVKAARAAGLDVVRTEFEPGRFVLIHKADAALAPGEAALEAWKAKHARPA